MWTTLKSRNRILLAILSVLPVIAAGCASSAASAPDPNNELPVGFVDQPTSGAAVGREMQMYGWAVDDRGIKDIWIFIDGRFVAHTTPNQPRADVAKAIPAYASKADSCGWAVTVPLSSVSVGPHKVLVQAVDTQGATRDIGVIDVTFGQ